MADFGRILILMGLILILSGTIILVALRLFPTLGNLPGDMTYEGRGFSFFMPFGTMLLVSLLGTLILNIVIRFFR